MSASDSSRVAYAPGSLVVGPTNLSAAFPHGGTLIGGTNGCALQCFTGYYPVTAWEEGGAPVEFIHRGAAWGVGAFLREWDDDALAACFPNTAVGAVSQHRVVSEPGTRAPGHRLSALAVKLLFVPDDPKRAPAWILYKAVPMPKEGTDMLFRHDAELGLEVAFAGILDASRRVIAIGRIEDLSL